MVGGDYNAKHQSWECRAANPRANLLYNLTNINKYKILSPQNQLTGQPTQKRNLTFWTYLSQKCPVICIVL
jgi:hypothetical protein